MANFTITAESIFESAKFQFLSGKFDVGFDVLRDSFDEEDVKDEVIMSFLKGEIGVLIDGDEITFADDSPPYNKLLKAMVLSIKKGDTVSL